MPTKAKKKSPKTAKPAAAKKKSGRAARPAGKAGAAAAWNTVLARSREVLSRTNSDGSVAIIRLDSDQHFFTLDGISAEVWNLLDGKKTGERILELMLKKHELPAPRFRKDVLKLFSDLRKESLVHEV